mgnify:CR=1 FL=1
MSPFKEKKGRLSPVREEQKKRNLSPQSVARDHGISYSHHKNSVQASERLFVDENNEKDEIIKHLSEINKNLKQENDQAVALINQRLGHVKGLIKNLINSSNKIVRFPLKKTPEMESAVKLYDVNRTALERHLEALVLLKYDTLEIYPFCRTISGTLTYHTAQATPSPKKALK